MTRGKITNLIASIVVTIICLAIRPAAAAQSAVNNSYSETAEKPVLIIHEACSQGSRARAVDKSCDTVIKKQEFDNLIAALDPRMPESNRLVLATEYVKLLVMGREAERLKIDEDSSFRELVSFTRLQLLERQLVRCLEKESSAISPADVVAFYREHPSQFEEGAFRKIYIPKQGQGSTAETAQAMQHRAAKGEDFDALQREIWTSQGRTAGAPLTHTGTLRRSTLPPTQEKVFDLKPGEVSAPIEEAAGYSIFRLEFKKVLPLSLVENEIRNAMASQRVQERINQLRSAVSVSVNEDYFGALPSTEELAKHHGLEHSGSHLVPMSESEKGRQ